MASALGSVRSTTTLCAFVLHVGCGGGSGGTSVPSAGGASDGGQSGASGSGGLAEGGAAGNSGSPGGSGTGGTTGGSGGSDGGELPLVPMDVGNEWTLRFVAIDDNLEMLETCEDPRASVGPSQTIQGTTGVTYFSFCSPMGVLITGSGDSLMAHPINSGSLGPAVEYIHSPVVEGESWVSGTNTYTWFSLSQPITVPAGTFSNCWERVAQVGAASFVYCRGMGLVAGVDSTNNWRIELVAKNF